MRGAVWGVTPVRGVTQVRGIRMRDRAYKFSAHFRVERGARTYCTNDCQHCHATRRKLTLETAHNPQREISHMRTIPACVIKSA
jgi:hypothetical protein